MDTNTLFTLGSIVLSVGVAYGVVKSQMKQFESRIEQLEADNKSNRELLIEIRSKLDLLLDGALKPRSK